MDTPIYDFVKAYEAAGSLRLHMPGHKGNGPLGLESLDITEITGADVLYSPDGIISRSEANASALFGTGTTVYSAEGSSLCIRGMLYMAKRMAGEDCTILAGRNAHKVFVTAAALMDIRVRWLYPEQGESLISCNISPEALDKALASMDVAPTAVYITSPDYLGNIADVAGLAAVARRYGCLLMVDNAHGAYLRFLSQSQHPMDLGADICCDSAHKTLPVLTGGAYLHVAKSAPEQLSKWANDAMAMFASTSPSYLILQSLDLANRYLAGSFRTELEAATALWQESKRRLMEYGYTLAGDEPLKLTILPKNRGYTGQELGQILEKNNIFWEFADKDHLVLMLPVKAAAEAAAKLETVLQSLPEREPIHEIPPAILPGRERVLPSKAIYMDSEELPVEQCCGRVMAGAAVSCPPAIPIVSIGQEITKEAVDAMTYYGISSVRVLL